MNILEFFFEMVFCYQNCSDLHTTITYCSSDRENFWNLRLKAENLQKVTHRQWVRTILITKYHYPWMTDAFFLRIKFLILQYCYLRFNKMIFSEIWQGKGNWTQLVDFIDIIVKNILFTYKICYLAIVCILNSVTR